MVSPGPRAPGLMHVTTATARAWAMAAAAAAAVVPAADAEASAWTVRGWADVAVGCLALDDPAAFDGLDEGVRSVPLASGGAHAARLRSLRRLAGPVPAWYPDARPVEGTIRGVGRRAWRAAALIERFGESLMTTAAVLPPGSLCPLSSARQLAWGARYRPLPSEGHVTVRLPVPRRLARRTWMCLPGLPAPGTAVAEVPSTATPLAQQVWRGIHEGAHLDHLAALSLPGVPAAPSPAEFGAGLLVSESYAMAVEILAAVECVLAGEGRATWQLGAGLIERATRLPGGSRPAVEFANLPTLAEVYVLGPLEILVRAVAGGALPLPEELTGSLRARWLAAIAAYPPAAEFCSAAASFSTDEDAEPDLNRRKSCIHRQPLPSYIKLTWYSWDVGRESRAVSPGHGRSIGCQPLGGFAMNSSFACCYSTATSSWSRLWPP